MKKDLLISFLLPFLLGFLVWYYSPEMTGKIEPWDSDSYYYIISLCSIGFITGLLSLKYTFLVYFGVVLSQSFFLTYSLQPSKFYLVGLFFVFLYSLSSLTIHIFVLLTKKELFGE